MKLYEATLWDKYLFDCVLELIDNEEISVMTQKES